MTREEAVSIIEERIHVTEYVESSYVDCVDMEALRVAIIALKQPEQHWIPTSKERPPQHQEIWITDIYGGVEVVYRGDGSLWLSNGDNGYYFEYEIIAWMPVNVPSPYQPKEESE